jgi:SIR2-like domain
MSSEFKIPESALRGLREAAQRGTLIPFVGAGASRLAGGPNWPEFADAALRQFVEDGTFSHAQMDQLRDQSPRVKLSIALALQEEHKSLIQFKKIFHPVNKMKSTKGLQLYGSLSKLAKTFVTTNYDEWLDEEIIIPSLSLDETFDPKFASITNKRRVIHETQHLIPANLNLPNTVIHLHGSICKPIGMIMTTSDYVRHYANDRSYSDPEKENRVLTFLDYLFDIKTVLFIGYGLEELEILEYVILKARNKPVHDGNEAKHYLIQGFFTHQTELMHSLRRYFLHECGIELIPFWRDYKDWDQLLVVVDELVELIPTSNLMYSQEFAEMEGMLDE